MKLEDIQAETVISVQSGMNEDENMQKKKNQDASSIAEHTGNPQ